MAGLRETRPLGESEPDRCEVPCSPLFGLAQGLQVDAELLALFVQVAALEAQSTRNVGHMEIVAVDFGEENFTLEGFGALLERSLCRTGLAIAPAGQGDIAGRKNKSHILGAYRVFGREQNEAFDDVAQFADVAGPGVAPQFGDGFVRKELFFPAVLPGDLTGEVGDEIGKILRALPQRRQDQGKNIDAVEQIAAKLVSFDEVFKVAVRGNEHSDVDLDGLVCADALDFAFFEDAEELGLHGDGHVANLIEKEGAAFGLFELADVTRGRARERAFFVSEELRLDELGGDGSAVEGHEGAFAAGRFFVDGARDKFLSGARLPEDADASFAGGDFFDLRQQFGDGGTAADKFVFAEAMAEFAVFVFEAREFEGIFDREEQLVGREGFFEEVQCPETSGFDGRFDVGLAGDKNDGSLDTEFLEFLEKLEAGFTGHDDVGKDKVEMIIADQFGGAEGIVANGGIVPGEAEGARQRGKGVGVVVDQEKMSLARHDQSVAAAARSDSATPEGKSDFGLTVAPGWCFGRSMRNVAPRPSSLVTEIVPW